ncbi:hypothetical protein RRG08_052885 [Elysia crispata]|uniref:Uncharacterized protein n=1 Tax=Elysia crispata TaxID=231223 RepID=A0AAE0ZG54_9GAST|nr:hypothetical protein RRG08_052885 [Elysia crispata]
MDTLRNNLKQTAEKRWTSRWSTGENDRIRNRLYVFWAGFFAWQIPNFPQIRTGSRRMALSASIIPCKAVDGERWQWDRAQARAGHGSH